MGNLSWYDSRLTNRAINEAIENNKEVFHRRTLPALFQRKIHKERCMGRAGM